MTILQRWSPGPRCLLPVLIGLVAILPYTSLLLTGDLVFVDSPYCDYSSFQVPMREFVQREFTAGRFPHWNPWVGCGIPMHATQQVAICYPLLTPLLFLFSANVATKISVFLHIVMAYAGQYFLGRRLKLAPQGAAISALIVTQSGFLTSHLAVGHISMVLDYGILPWFFLSLVATCDRPSWSSSFGLAITVGGLMLVGHPQLPYYAFLIAGIWAAGSLLWGVAANQRGRVCGHFLCGIVVGLLISSIQLMPAIELARDNNGLSERGTFEYAKQYSLTCIDAFRMIVPSLCGNSLKDIPEFHPPDFIHEKVCYLGVVTWWLIFASTFCPTKDRWARAAAWLSIFAFIISLGPSTFLFEMIGNITPGMFLFRCPGRCMGVATLLLALLAGRGFDLLGSWSGRFWRQSGLRLLVYLLAVDGAVTFLLDRAMQETNWTRWGSFATEHLQGELQVSLLIVLASLAFIRWNRLVAKRTRCVVAVAILAIDLGFFNTLGVRYEPENVQPLPSTLVADGDQFRFIEGHEPLSFSKDAVRYSRFVPHAVRSKVRMIGTNEGGVLPAACEKLYRALQNEPEETLRQSSCRYLLSNTRQLIWSKLPDALPRIRFVPDSEIKDATDSSAGDAIQILTDDPQLLVVEIKSPNNGMLVLSDTFYPGWSAVIDGKPAEIKCVRECFRAVPVPSGNHSIQIEYRPQSFILGCRLTAVGVAALGLLAWFAIRQSRHEICAQMNPGK